MKSVRDRDLRITRGEPDREALHQPAARRPVSEWWERDFLYHSRFYHVLIAFKIPYHIWYPGRLSEGTPLPDEGRSRGRRYPWPSSRQLAVHFISRVCISALHPRAVQQASGWPLRHFRSHVFATCRRSCRIDKHGASSSREKTSEIFRTYTFLHRTARTSDGGHMPKACRSEANIRRGRRRISNHPQRRTPKCMTSKRGLSAWHV